MEIITIEGVEYVRLEQFSRPILIDISGLEQSDLDKLEKVEKFLLDMTDA